MNHLPPEQQTIHERLQQGFLSDTREGKAQMLAAQTKVAAVILRPITEAFSFEAMPVCDKCGWIDGCVDDDHGSVITTWYPVSTSTFRCAGCVNGALHGPQVDDGSIPF